MGRNAYCMRFRPVPSEGESFMASKQKILIVDDDNNIAELISLYLTKECYDTKIVNDGEEAVREFHSFQPNLILLDLMLPGMDGYQVCREIRQHQCRNREDNFPAGNKQKPDRIHSVCIRTGCPSGKRKIHS